MRHGVAKFDQAVLPSAPINLMDAGPAEARPQHSSERDSDAASPSSSPRLGGEEYLSVRWSATAGSPVVDEPAAFGLAPRALSISSTSSTAGGDGSSSWVLTHRPLDLISTPRARPGVTGSLVSHPLHHAQPGRKGESSTRDSTGVTEKESGTPDWCAGDDVEVRDDVGQGWVAFPELDQEHVSPEGASGSHPEAARSAFADLSDEGWELGEAHSHSVRPIASSC